MSNSSRWSLCTTGAIAFSTSRQEEQCHVPEWSDPVTESLIPCQVFSSVIKDTRSALLKVINQERQGTKMLHGLPSQALDLPPA